MIIPAKFNSRDEYVESFLSHPVSIENYPDQKQRAAVAYSLWEHRNMLENSNGDWVKVYSCKFIEPGLVNYKEFGTVLVTKPVLDSMLESFKGKPVINEVHRDIYPGIYKDGKADGTVLDVWYNQEDGWYWAEFAVWDPATQRNCESSAYSVSCAYEVNNVKEAHAEHNSIPYQQEVLDGEYTHMAIVSNPRYEGARIVYNSKGGNVMFKFWKKGSKKEAKNASDIDLENAKIKVDNAEVTMKELIDTFKAEEAEKATKADLEKKNESISEEDLIEIDGVEKTVRNLMDCYRSSKTRKNAEEEDKKKKEEEVKNAEEESKKKKEAEDLKNAEDEAKKKKEEEERKNAEEEAKKKKDLENSKGEDHFASLQKAATLRGEPTQPEIRTRRELIKAGAEKYGSK